MDDGYIVETVLDRTYHRSATWRTSTGSPIDVRFSGPAEDRAKIDEQFERVRKIIEKEMKP
jgi:hypothetical protein